RHCLPAVSGWRQRSRSGLRYGAAALRPLPQPGAQFLLRPGAVGASPPAGHPLRLRRLAGARLRGA
nr:hypothetical protein [Tanacetum cinerariifolium]